MNLRFTQRRKRRRFALTNDIYWLVYAIEDHIAELIMASLLFIQVIATGGLHVVGTERHESRRIDNQVTYSLSLRIYVYLASPTFARNTYPSTFPRQF